MPVTVTVVLTGPLDGVSDMLGTTDHVVELTEVICLAVAIVCTSELGLAW
jgi:hypothetical protein